VRRGRRGRPRTHRDKERGGLLADGSLDRRQLLHTAEVRLRGDGVITPRRAVMAR
jgi:hypothetical protein